MMAQEPRDSKSADQPSPTFDPGDAALVLVDVDKKSFDQNIEKMQGDDPSLGADLVRRTYDLALPNLIRLLENFRKINRPVVFVQWGWHRFQFPPLLRRDDEDVVIKQSRGAFASSNLHEVLGRRRARTCVFAGADTAICVISTVCGAIDHGYRAAVVEDACISLRPQTQEAALHVMRNMGAMVLTTQQVLES